MIKKLLNLIRNLQKINSTLDFVQQSLGRIESRQLFPVSNSAGLQSNEFKVYSQSGEDGIIQYLINKIQIQDKRFIEFGVENYLESNTRFLAINNYWSGLVIDGDLENIEFIKNDPIYWRCNIKAEHSFVTKDNINEIFLRNGLSGDIGLLSIDIDGNDYWIWETINTISPAIVIAEYNSFFGAKREITVPYNPTFVRKSSHFSKIFYGASIAALTALANKKGYKLVGSNQAGNNVFFARNDLMTSLSERSIEDTYKQIQFREVHNERGELNYLSFNDARKVIGELKVYDIKACKEVTVNSLWE
jgi:hypothetical protein